MTTPAQSTCTRPEKVRYPSRSDARHAKRQIRHAVNRRTLTPYLCGCGFWHLGNATAELRASKREHRR